jgi:hypothetical protein
LAHLRPIPHIRATTKATFNASHFSKLGASTSHLPQFRFLDHFFKRRTWKPATSSLKAAGIYAAKKAAITLAIDGD